MGSALEEMREAHKARHERMWGTPQPVPMPAPRPAPMERVAMVKARLSAPEPLAPTNPRYPSISHIQDVVSAYFGVPKTELLGSRRAVPIVRARHTAMLLSKRLTPRSLCQIGKQFGRGDHTTVLLAVRKMEALAAADPEFAATVEALSEEINPSGAVVERRKPPASYRMPADLALQIYQRATAGEGYRSIAESCGCSMGAVASIRRGRNWSHLTGEPRRP